MKFALLMLFGTVCTRIVYHFKNRFKPVSLQEESLDFIITFVIYTATFLAITYILSLWN
jgi:hypothetical protein